RVRARYAETDTAGVVYHSNYLYWFEIGRTELMRDTGFPYAAFERERGLLLTVAEAHLEYRRPVRYDDVVRVESRLDDFRRVGFTVRHRLSVEPGDALCCTGHVRLACVDRAGKVRPIPADVAAALEKWTEGPPPGKIPPPGAVSPHSA
ncbi:MAG TPA: thioesterase family protein, partial [Planctomycetota bacterium]|nr:thioesterase family protein [Planctomycetota bacterium]